ncbi:MAG: hypothetical protein JNL60_12705 [Bacteroidia bacterium]|nr:hypothetical protein [Bacteroidia bacterium]
MKMQPRLFSTLIAIFISVLANAQDLIVKTDGSRIFCEIIKVDSVSISYMRVRDKVEQHIARTDVEKYYIGKRQSNKRGNSPLVSQAGNTVVSQQEVVVLGFFAGRPMPLGKFASKKLDESTSGYALDGYMLGANLTLKIVNEFGFNLSFVYQVNRFDHMAISEALNTSFPGGNFTASSTPWKMRGFFLGPLVNLNVKQIEGLSIRMEVKAGFPIFYQPEIITRGYLNGFNVGITSSGDPVRSIAAAGSFGLVYKFARNAAFTIDVDYFSAKPSFIGTNKNTFGYTEYFAFEQPYKTITPRAGLCFLLGHRK